MEGNTDTDLKTSEISNESRVETKPILPQIPEKSKENVIIHSEKNRLTESQIKKEFIYFKLYQQMGVNVPDCQLSADENNKTILEINKVPLVNLNYYEESRDAKIQKQTNVVKMLANVLGDKRHSLRTGINSNHDVVVLTDLHDPEAFTTDEATNIRVICRNDPDLVNNLSESLNKLTPEFILETVKESKLSDEDSRELILKILINKKNILENIPQEKEGVVILFNQKDINKIDQILTNSKVNEKFKEVFSASANVSERISRIEKITSESITPDLQPSFNMKFSEIKNELGEIHKVEDKDEKIDKLFNLQRVLIDKKKGIIGKLNGGRINKLLSTITKVKNHLLDEEYLSLNSNSEYLSSQIEKSLIHERGDHNEIHDQIAPSPTQILELTKLASKLENIPKSWRKNENSTHKCTTSISKLELRYKDFLNFCQKRNLSVVSHLSTHHGILKALEGGTLESSLRQKEKDKNPYANSPAGKREWLPQLTFAVNGASIGYGGVKSSEGYGATGQELSAGFVGSYPEVVEDQNVDEFASTATMYDAELHIFNPQHSDTKDIGEEIPIDKLFLLVPEKEKQKWVDFILTKGKNNNPEWVEKHLKTYPSQMTIDTYLKFYAKQEEFSFENKKGIFVDNGDRVKLHQDWHDSAYKWVNI